MGCFRPDFILYSHLVVPWFCKYTQRSHFKLYATQSGQTERQARQHAVYNN